MATPASAMEAKSTAGVPWFKREDARRAVREWMREWSAPEVTCRDLDCAAHRAVCGECGGVVDVDVTGLPKDHEVDALVDSILRVLGLEA